MNDHQAVVKKLTKRGWTLVTGRKHNCLVHASGAKIFVSKTSSDVRAARNLLAMARRIESGRQC